MTCGSAMSNRLCAGSNWRSAQRAPRCEPSPTRARTETASGASAGNSKPSERVAHETRRYGERRDRVYAAGLHMTRERARKVLAALDAWLASPGRIDVREALVDALTTSEALTTQEPRIVPVSEVIARVAKAFGVRVNEIAGRHRGQYSTQPRHVVMLLLREQGMSYPGIARVLGMDHTSVMHGVKSIQRAANNNPLLSATVNALRAEMPNSVQPSRTQDEQEDERNALGEPLHPLDSPATSQR